MTYAAPDPARRPANPPVAAGTVRSAAPDAEHDRSAPPDASPRRVGSMPGGGAPGRADSPAARLLSAALLGACAGSNARPPVAPLPACTPGGLSFDLRVPIRTVTGGDIRPAALENLLTDAAPTFAALGLTVERGGRSTTTARAALGRAGDDADTALLPLVDLLAAVASPGAPPDAVRVVLLPHVVDPASALARGPVLEALTLTPEAVAGDALAVPLAALATPWAPSVILGLDELLRLDPPVRAAVLAHELGHALGLPHLPSPGNLMHPDQPACLGAIEPSQRDLSHARAAALRPGLLSAWIALFTAGCPARETCETMTSPTLELGVGTAAFEPLPADGALAWEEGPQGGFHVWGALRATDIEPGEYGVNKAEIRPMVSFKLLDGDTPMGGYQDLPQVFQRAGDAWVLVAEQLFLFTSTPQDYVGAPLTLTAIVDDACEHHLESTADVTLAPPPG